MESPAAQYLNDGTYTLLLVDASPSGGNLTVSEHGNNQFTIDSNIDLDPPTQTVVISSITDDVAPATGTVADGGTTNDTAPALAGTLSAVLLGNEVLSIFRDGIKIGKADVVGINWTFSDAGPLVDGTSYTYTARVVDAANNLGPASNAYDITIDTSNPTAAVDITAIADDTGTAGDFTTSDTTLTVSGTHGALGAGEKVQVSSDGGTTWSDVTTSDATTWSFTDPDRPRRELHLPGAGDRCGGQCRQQRQPGGHHRHQQLRRRRWTSPRSPTTPAPPATSPPATPR